MEYTTEKVKELKEKGYLRFMEQGIYQDGSGFEVYMHGETIISIPYIFPHKSDEWELDYSKMEISY